MDGDILVKADHHIGYVSAAGTIIEAQDSHLGVQKTPGFNLAGPALGRTSSVWRARALQSWLGRWAGGASGTATRGSTTSAPRESQCRARRFRSTRARRPPSRTTPARKQIVAAPMPCKETFWNAGEGCEQMNANSNLYSPLVAKQMA